MTAEDVTEFVAEGDEPFLFVQSVVQGNAIDRYPALS